MKNAVRTVSNIFFIIFFSKILGQVREMMIANSYGTGMEASAFMTATQIPLNFFDIILGAAIVSAFVPVFNEYYNKGGMALANRFTNNFVGIIALVSLVISALGVIFSASIVGILAKGFDAETAHLTSRLLKILFPAMLFTAVAYAYAGVLQSLGEFKAPAAMSIVSNGITILYLLIFKNKFGVFGLAFSMLLGWIMQLILLIPYLVRFKFKFGLNLNFKDPGMKKVYALAFPILLSSWVQPLNVMFNTYLASFLNGGQAVSAINYANKLYLIIASVFTVAVTNLTLPTLSSMFSKGLEKEAGDVIGNALKATTLFILPVMALFILFAKPIVEIVYQSGEFNELSVHLTSSALMLYSVGMAGYAWQEVLNKSFYALQKSKIPMQTAFLTIGVNIVLSLCLFKILGIGGLALSAALAATVSGTVLFIRIRKQNAFITTREILTVLLKAAVSACLSGGAAYAVYFGFLQGYAAGRIQKLLLVGAVCLAAIVFYLILLIVFRCKEIYGLKQILKKEEKEDNAVE